ncbi:MAG: FtsX-like permease family protein, partial [Rhodothermales bacterium]
SALSSPGSLVLTESTAARLFGTADPIGQTIYRNGTDPYTIAAIAGDPPPNTHLPFNVLISAGELETRTPAALRWNFFGARVYLKLTPGVDRPSLVGKLNALRAEHVDGPFEAWRLDLQSVSRIHLHSDLNDEFAPTSDVRYLYIFGAAGLLILLISCVNYVNLATARSTDRATEVGVRKVLGAQREQLVGLFISESIVIALLALPFALLFASVALPIVNDLTGQQLSLSLADHPTVWIAVVLTLLIVGIAAGSYPAFVLSAFRPMRVLRGGQLNITSKYWVRRGLILFQFAATVALAAGALVVHSQLEYLQTTRLGFDAEEIVSFRPPDWTSDDLSVFAASVASEPSIESVAAGMPLGIGWRTYTMPRETASGETWQLDMLSAGYGYVETVGLELVAGRSFSRKFGTDAENALIVTRSTAERLGLEGDGLGPAPEPFDGLQVIGVVEDIHNVSLRQPLRPTAVQLDPSFTGVVLAKLDPGRTEEGLSVLERAWEAQIPDRPFAFEFLDEEIQAQYQSEQRLSSAFALFAGLAILLAGIGLFGLSAYSVRQRTKEIGIRKVLGASVASIVGLLTKEFVILAVVAIAIGTPLAYVGMNRWLNEFAYHVEPGLWLLLMVATLAIVVAVVSAGMQAVRAAASNPATTIRYD